MDKSSQIFSYLESTPFAVDAPDKVRFLAAGEYNENYLVQHADGPVVVRINHGSQLGLGDGQIEYEYRVLQAVADSGVTPKPYLVDAGAVPGPLLIMEYLDGRSLQYEIEMEEAARIFARIHTLPIDENLIVQADPVADIAAESLGLINRFTDHPMKAQRDHLLRYHEQIVLLGEQTKAEFDLEPMCMVNTEVNSGNFIMSEDRGWLVDWEKAVVSCRYQDLGHFLVPTTTLWKTDHQVGQEERTGFLMAYGEAARLDLDMYMLSRRTAIMERTILLRALSWCYMAWYEYTRSDRALTNDQTYSRIKWYLDEIECFLQ